MSHHGCPERLSNRSKGFQEEGGQATMEVLVETLTGTAFEMTVSPSDTILAIKSKICRVEGIPVAQQHLVFQSRELEDGQCLSGCGVTAGARLRLVLGLRGGPVATRRLPPHQPPPDLYTDIERLLHSNRDDGDWACGSSSNCRVTVVVFRDGERVNMLRVRESDAEPEYSVAPAPPPAPARPAALNTPCMSSPLSEHTSDEACGGSYAQNAVTMGKMMELRRRMESLALRRHHHGEGEIQKTRSEETLSVPSLLEQPEYSLECLAAPDTERLSVSDALSGPVLMCRRRGRGVRDAALLERLRAQPDLPSLEYVPLGDQELIGGSSAAWRARTFGSSTQLSPPAAPPPPPPRAHPPAHPTSPHPAHARSASSLHVRAQPPPRHTPPLSDAVFSSSTSDLEQLRRNRLLPALSRHRNTEHLHLSDEHLHLPRPPPPAHQPPPPPRGVTGAIGAERRQRRIDKIAELDNCRFVAELENCRYFAELDNSRFYRFEDFDAFTVDDEKETPKPKQEEKNSEMKEKDGEFKEKDGEVKEKIKKVRIRCGFCNKKLSIATVHRCRCGAQYCAPHRYAEVHGCAYDYKANATRYLERANPLVSAPKLPKI